MDRDFFLIQKIKNSDEKSSEIFVSKYYPQIFRYCFLHTKDYQESEDLTQEVFMSFFFNIDRYKNYGKVLNYLYVIASNKCKDYYKKKKDIYVDDMQKVEHICLGNKYMSSIEELQLRIDVENALEKLPNEIKEVAMLFFFQGIKQREIAKILNIKLSLVKYRVNRSKKILSEYLGS